MPPPLARSYGARVETGFALHSPVLSHEYPPPPLPPLACSYGARVETGFALHSLREGLMGVYRAEGMAGLWKGSRPSILKVGGGHIIHTLWKGRGATSSMQCPSLPPCCNAPSSISTQSRT